MSRYDTDRLRQDMMDDYGTGAFSGMPAMMMEVWEIESMSKEELLERAEEEGIDLEEYEDY